MGERIVPTQAYPMGILLVLFGGAALHCAGSETVGDRSCPGVLDGGPDAATDAEVDVVGSIRPPAEVRQIAVDASGSAYARLADGRVFRWGRQLSDGETGSAPSVAPLLQPAEVPELFGIVQLGMSFHRACAITSSHRTVCWGVDPSRGLDDTSAASLSARVVPTDIGIDGAVSVATTPTTSCAVVQDGHVLCWGLNNSLQTYPDIASANDGVIKTPRAVPKITNAVAVGLGSTGANWGGPVSCALLATGEVDCWGGPLKTDPAFTDYGPLPVEGLTEIASITAGQFVLATRKDGRVLRLAEWGWTAAPDQTNTEIRYVDSANPAVGVSGTYGATGIVRTDGRVDFMQHYPAWAADIEGRLTASVYEPITNATALAMEQLYACIVDKDGAVQCAGANDVGQLGDGTRLARRSFAPVVWPTSSR